MKEKSWLVYIIRCKDGKLYTGITNDIVNRIGAHNEGRGCKFTRCRYPVELLYREKCGTMSAARKREIGIQGLRRGKKLELISNH